MGSGKLLLLKLLVRDLFRNWPALQAGIFKALAKWRNDVLAELTKLVVLLVCVWSGFLVVLIFAAALWAVFADTPMGEIFATRVSPDLVTTITSVLKLDLLRLAYECVLNTLIATFLIGLGLKFTGLYRLAFQNRGLLGVTFWGIACTAVGAAVLPIIETAGAMRGNAVIYFLPTICLVHGSVNFSARLVPEFTVIFRFGDFLRGRLQIIKIRDLPYNHKES